MNAQRQPGPSASHQRTTRTPARIRPRPPQPDQLRRPMPTRSRRLQTPGHPFHSEEPRIVAEERLSEIESSMWVQEGRERCW